MVLEFSIGTGRDSFACNPWILQVIYLISEIVEFNGSSCPVHKDFGFLG